MVAGYRIGRAAPDLRIGADKVAAIYLGSQRLYPSSLTWSTDLLQRGTFTTTRYPANFKVGLAALVFDTLYLTATRRDAVLRAKRLVTATQQTYTMTFPTVPFRRALRMSCNHTLIQLYGQDAIVALGNIMGAEQGLFALTGRAVDMAPDRYLEMVSRTFSLTGPATNVRATRRLTMAQASFSLTGQNMAASENVLFPTNGTNYSLAGQAMTPKAGRRLNAAPQTGFTLAGQAMTPKVARKLVMAMGARTLTGQAAHVRANRKIVLNPIYGGYDGFSMLGQAVTLTYDATPALASSATGGSSSQVSSFDAPLPTGVGVGDLLLVFVTLQTNAARTITTPSGWTELYNEGPSATTRRAACYYRYATGSEGSALNLTASATAWFATLAVRITSASAIAVNIASATSTAGDPPLLTPPWNGKLWLASDHAAGSVNGANPNPPAGYPSIIRSVVTGGSPFTLLAYKTALLSSDDPSAMTGLSNNAMHVNATIAIR